MKRFEVAEVKIDVDTHPYLTDKILWKIADMKPTLDGLTPTLSFSAYTSKERCEEVIKEKQEQLEGENVEV